MISFHYFMSIWTFQDVANLKNRVHLSKIYGELFCTGEGLYLLAENGAVNC